MVTEFLARGWARFPFDRTVADWADRARIAARKSVADPAYAHWHVCGNTWFVGVDALDNDTEGRVEGSTPLAGPVVDAIAAVFGAVPPLHRGQVSVIRPGYPLPREGESAAAFRYRVRRDAAHVDGIKLASPARRRTISERHAFILGLPVTETDPGAAPLVVWDGSHRIIRAALQDVLAGHDPDAWGGVEVTEAYQAARREVFDTCPRIPLHARPGESYLLHRLALHGVAPWDPGADAPEEGRIIVYFRPHLAGPVADWLNRP